MGIVFRQAIKTTIVIAAGAVLGAAINYIYTRVFPQNLVGVSRNLLNQGAAIYLFLLLGSVSLVHIYAQRYGPGDPRRPVLFTFSMLVPPVTTALFCVPYFLLKHYIVGRYQGVDRQYIEAFYAWLPVLCLLLCYMTLLEYYLLSRMKIAAASAQREVLLRLANILLIGAFFVGWIDFHAFVVSTVLVHLLPVSVLWVMAARTEGFSISFNWRLFSREEARRIVHYAWYHLLLAVILNLSGLLEVLLLGPLSANGLKDVAIYNLALFLISILTIPHRALSSAAFPRINEAFVAEDPQLNILFTRSAINIQVVAVAMWILVACNLHNIIAILPAGYEAIAPTFLIISLGRMVDMVTGLNTELISITNHYKYTFRLSVLLVLFLLVFDRIFIPKYGLYGAAWVSAAAGIGFNLCKLIFLYTKMKMLPFTRQTVVIIALGAATFLSNYAMPPFQNAILDAMLRSAMLLTVYGVLMLLFRPSPDLSEYLAQVRRNKRLF